jgi:excisionase family DNA binding protein
MTPPLSDKGNPPLVVSPREAWRLLACGNTRGYALLAAGELESYLDGRSRRITMRSIHRYIAERLAETNGSTLSAPTASLPRHRGRPRRPASTIGGVL